MTIGFLVASWDARFGCMHPFMFLWQTSLIIDLSPVPQLETMTTMHALAIPFATKLHLKDFLLVPDPAVLDYWEPPAVWTCNATLAQHLDALVHLHFHGIFKETCQFLIGWLMDCRSLSFFNQYYSGLLEPILYLSLDWWCKLTTFDGSFSGWLAETCLGLSKKRLWFWSSLLCVSQDPEYQPPSTPYQTWLEKECKGWLRAQNIDVFKLGPGQGRSCQIYGSRGRPPWSPAPMGGC